MPFCNLLVSACLWHQIALCKIGSAPVEIIWLESQFVRIYELLSWKQNLGSFKPALEIAAANASRSGRRSDGPSCNHVRGGAAMAAINLAQQATIALRTAHLSTSSSTVFTTQTNAFLPPDSPTSKRISKHWVMATPECSSSSSGVTDSQGGRILRQVLSKEGRTKMNLASDRGFYSAPRLVTHVDDQFLPTLTNLYRERIPDDGEVLDLMSSWVSHLPAEKKYKRVVGHGLNAQELSRNRQLDHFFVKDLNAEPKLENADGSFDAVLCTVSVQYLEQPEKVFAEIYRVLRPGGVCIVSFSNRMFYEKAVAAWREGSDYSRTQLVKQYFQCIDGFTAPEVVKKLPQAKSSQEASLNPFSFITSLFASAGRDPFYAVVAHRNFKPIRE